MRSRSCTASTRGCRCLLMSTGSADSEQDLVPSWEVRSGEGMVQGLGTGKQTVMAFIDAVWVHADLEALDRFWTGSCVNHAAPAGHDVGLVALRSYHESFAASFGAFSDSSIQVLQQVEEGDRVVTQLVTSARHTGEFAGRPSDRQAGHSGDDPDRPARGRQDRGGLVRRGHQRADGAAPALI